MFSSERAGGKVAVEDSLLAEETIFLINLQAWLMHFLYSVAVLAVLSEEAAAESPKFHKIPNMSSRIWGKSV